jgi:uncharacterized membrane protein
MRTKKPMQHLVAKVPRRSSKVGTTIGSILGISGAITAPTTKMVELSTGVVSEPTRPA